MSTNSLFHNLGSFVINSKWVHTYELKSNGFKVTLIPIAGQTVAANLVNKFGSASEHVRAKSGSLHLLEHLYFRVGKLSKSMDGTPFDLGNKFGCYVNAETTASSMSLVTHGHVDYEEEIVKNFATRSQDFFIDPAAKVAEEQAVFNEAERSLTSPYMQVITHVAQLGMSDTGFSSMTIGTIADVSNVTADDLMALKEYFSKPNNMHLVMSGAVGADSLKHVAKHFGAIPRAAEVERPGLLPQEPQISPRQESILVDGSFAVCALAFRSPVRKPFEFSKDDVMLRVVQKAIDRPEIQQHFGTSFVNTSVFNPEYVASFLFTFLSCPQVDPGAFPQAIGQALEKVAQLPEPVLKSIVKDLKYNIDTSFTSAHEATELVAGAIGTQTFDTVKQIHNEYCTMIKPNYSIQKNLAQFVQRFFNPEQSTFVVGVPKNNVKPTPKAQLMPKPKLNKRAMLGRRSMAGKVQVVEKNHNVAVVQKTMPSVYVNISIPFKTDGALKQEATHTLLANVLNSVPLPPNVSASTRRSYSAGHDVFHIATKVNTAGALEDIVKEFKAPNYDMFENVRNTAASMSRGDQMNATAIAKVMAINAIYSQSPFKNYTEMPNALQNTNLQDIKNAHAELLQNMSSAHVTFTGDWESDQSIARYKGEIQKHFNTAFTPLKGVVFHKLTGEKMTVDYFVPESGQYSVRQHNTNDNLMIDAHLISANTIPQFQWVNKKTNERFQRRELSNIATSTIMYAVSFPKHLKTPMSYAMNMMGDSMAGWTMRKVRWEDAQQCYGINGQVVSTNAKSQPLAVLVGTVGADALEKAKSDIQWCFDNHCGKITQEELDTAHQRMVGERIVKTDFAENIHGLVHSNLVAGEDPTLELTKPSLAEVNEASMFFKHMAKVEVVPTMHVAAAKVYRASERAIDRDMKNFLLGIDDLDFDSEEEI